MPKIQDVFTLTPKVESHCVKIAVIYAKRIKQESSCFIAFEKYFEDEREKLHNIFLKKEEMLRQKAEKINKMPSSTAKQKLNEELQKQAQEMEKELQARKEAFLKKINTITTKLQDHLDNAIDSVIQKYGFTMVLNAEIDEKTLVMYADKRYDITHKIIQHLNDIQIKF